MSIITDMFVKSMKSRPKLSVKEHSNSSLTKYSLHKVNSLAFCGVSSFIIAWSASTGGEHLVVNTRQNYGQLVKDVAQNFEARTEAFSMGPSPQMFILVSLLALLI